MSNTIKSLEVNEKIIKDLFGNDFYKSSLKDKLNVSDCVLANEKLSEYLYGTKIANLLKQDNQEEIKKIIQETKNKYKNRRSLIEDSNLDNIAMIVVRPENIEITNRYIEFLENKGLDLIYQKNANITFEQYLLMYHHGLIIKESKNDFPTRTLNYIDKDCRVLLFKKENNNTKPLSDYITNIKGKQGKNKIDTLRGDIAFNHLKQYVDKDGKKFNDDIYNIYFDPIGMCRLIVRNKLESDNSHDIADLKLLYYVGQAVHVPNSKELKDDLSVLLDENEIDLVEQKTKKRKSIYLAS